MGTFGQRGKMMKEELWWERKYGGCRNIHWKRKCGLRFAKKNFRQKKGME